MKTQVMGDSADNGTKGQTQKQSTEKKRKRISYKKELEKAVQENTVLKDRLLRLVAEFDNYRKRTERERNDLMANAGAHIIAQLLPVLDDLNRSLEASEKNDDLKLFVDGIRIVRNNFVKILREQGLKPIESIGQEFDPQKHEALMQIAVEGKESDIVVDEHIKGYEFNNRVIRHAKVIVSK